MIKQNSIERDIISNPHLFFYLSSNGRVNESVTYLFVSKLDQSEWIFFSPSD